MKKLFTFTFAFFAAFFVAAQSVDFKAVSNYVGTDFGTMAFVDLKKAAENLEIFPDAAIALESAKNPQTLQAAMISAMNALSDLGLSSPDAPFSCDALAQAFSRMDQVLISLSSDSVTILIFGNFSDGEKTFFSNAAFEKTGEKIGGKTVYSGERGKVKFVLDSEKMLAMSFSGEKFFAKKSNAKLAKYQKEFFEKWVAEKICAFCFSPSGTAKLGGQIFDIILKMLDKDNSLAELKQSGIDLAKYRPTLDAYFARCAQCTEIEFGSLDFSIASAERFSASMSTSTAQTSQDFADFSYDLLKILADCQIWSDLSTVLGVKASLTPSIAGKRVDCNISVSK